MIVKCRICSKVVGPGGAKSDELCARHYAAQRRGRPLVAELQKVAGKEGEELKTTLPKPLARKLRRMGKATGVSVSAIIRDILEANLAGGRHPAD